MASSEALAATIVGGTTEIAERAAALAVIRALYLLGERAGSRAITGADALVVAQQVGRELDAKIANTKERTNG